MANRLSVIMVHSTAPTVAAGQIAEAVVGELIGLNGIDLTLVGPLSGLGESSTDRLTLDSLGGDVVVLDWQSPSEIVVALRGLGFEGQRAPHQHDPQVPAPAANLRRIYAIDLSRFSGSDDVLQALSRLKTDRQVRTFSLGIPRSDSPKMIPATGRPRSQDLDTSAALGQAEDVSTPALRGQTLDLDDLLDQLDQLDP